MRERKNGRRKKRNIFLTRTYTHNEACGRRITCDVVPLFCVVVVLLFFVFLRETFGIDEEEEEEDNKEAIGLGPSRSVDDGYTKKLRSVSYHGT